MKDKVPAVGGRCDGQPDMLVARKELKGPTSNFIRFTELTQALLLISAIFFIDLYWPVQSVTVPSWGWVASVLIWACTVLVVLGRLTLPSVRDLGVFVVTRV